jgi:hypothetical protein
VQHKNKDKMCARWSTFRVETKTRMAPNPSRSPYVKVGNSKHEVRKSAWGQILWPEQDMSISTHVCMVKILPPNSAWASVFPEKLLPSRIWSYLPAFTNMDLLFAANSETYTCRAHTTAGAYTHISWCAHAYQHASNYTTQLFELTREVGQFGAEPGPFLGIAAQQRDHGHERR